MQSLLILLEDYLVIETLASVFLVQIILLLLTPLLLRLLVRLVPTERTRSRLKTVLVIAILVFPLIALSYVIAKKISQLPSATQKNLELILRLFFTTGIVLLITGAWMHTELLVWSLMLLYWIDYLKGMIAAANEDDRSADDDPDDDDGPTPTGDAVELFLRTQQRA